MIYAARFNSRAVTFSWTKAGRAQPKPRSPCRAAPCSAPGGKGGGGLAATPKLPRSCASKGAHPEPGGSRVLGEFRVFCTAEWPLLPSRFSPGERPSPGTTPPRRLRRPPRNPQPRFPLGPKLFRDESGAESLLGKIEAGVRNSPIEGVFPRTTPKRGEKSRRRGGQEESPKDEKFGAGGRIRPGLPAEGGETRWDCGVRRVSNSGLIADRTAKIK